MQDKDLYEQVRKLVKQLDSEWDGLENVVDRAVNIGKRKALTEVLAIILINHKSELTRRK